MTFQAYGVGGLLRSFRALSPKGEQLERRLAQLICPELLESGALPIGEASPDNAQPSRRPGNAFGVPQASLDFRSEISTPQEGGSNDDPGLPTELVRLEEGTSVLGPLPQAFASVISFAPLVPLDPLFLPRNARPLLGAVATTSRADGPIDVERIVEILSRGRPILKLPRKPIRSLHAGVEVLVDIGVAMLPFRLDQEDVIARLSDVVGRSLVRVRYFEDCPSRGVDTPSGETGPYEPPSRGTLVLVLSDFGVARPASAAPRPRPSEWTDFGEVLARSGCPAAGLSPYSVAKAPREIARRLPIVHWDRRTTAGAVRRTLGRKANS